MPRATPDGMKVCSKCRENKPVGEFYKSTASVDGVTYHCKTCVQLAKKTYYEAHKDKVKAVNAAWRAANPDRVKAVKAAWIAANPDKVRAERNAWKAANPDKVKAGKAAWRAANLDKYRAMRKTYAARLPDFLVKRYLNLKDAPPELIELKRLQVQIKRELKRQEQSK